MLSDTTTEHTTTPTTKIIGGIVLVILLALITLYLYGYYYTQNLEKPPTEQTPPKSELPTYTTEDKLHILEGLALKGTKDTQAYSGKEKLKTLTTLSQQSPPQTLTEAEKLTILNSLSK